MSRLSGMDLRKALARFVELGGVVEPIRRTGEVRCYHPALPKRLTLNARRKDAPRALTVAIRRLEDRR